MSTYKPYRYLPSYYTDEDFPEFEALPESEREAVLEAIDNYHKHVIEAVNFARKKFIDPLTDKYQRLIYSRTWGKY